MDIRVRWESRTEDGLFGRLRVLDGDDVRFECVCDTNLKLRIEDGTYSARVDMSPRLKYRCPHIMVPSRDERAGGDAGLRLHIANEPSQSLGCIFPGLKIAGDAVEGSRIAFNGMMALLPTDESEFTVTIETAL